jgi:hypothetical protein
MGEEEEDPEIAEEPGFSNGKAILVIAIVVNLSCQQNYFWKKNEKIGDLRVRKGMVY